MPALLVCLLALLVLPLRGTASPLFDADDLLQVELAGPFSSLFADRDQGERAFTLTYAGVAQSVRVRTRGKSRADLCRFPPLRLNFKRPDMAGTIFEGQDKLRLVTHCKTSPRFEQNVLEEYAAYRIFRLITETAYAVRLLRVTYVDTDAAQSAPVVRYAFLMESDEEFNQRVGARAAELAAVSRTRLNKTQEAAVYVFQYLIGNTDWSLVTAHKAQHCCHNGRLKWIGSELFYVPYDFDLAGLVNAAYAYPDRRLPIKRVTQRLYRGHCVSQELLRETLGAVEDRREAILDTMRDLPVVVDKDARKALRFLEGYFEASADREKLMKAFQRKCR